VGSAKILGRAYQFSTIGTLLAKSELSASPGGKDFGQMELKIVMLLALIAAIATASYVGGRSQTQERTN
jgi:hypothetical protein